MDFTFSGVEVQKMWQAEKIHRTRDGCVKLICILDNKMKMF